MTRQTRPTRKTPAATTSYVAGDAPPRFRHGLVIGTFYPPHAGHLALVRAALSRCDVVTLEVLGGSTESIPVELRVEWMREEAPTAHLASVVDDAEIDFASESAWQHHTEVIAGLVDPADGPVEALFTSDAYGEELARRLGAEWVRVDPSRSALTVSSTAVRADVSGTWWALPAAVRAYLTRRVDVVGPDLLVCQRLSDRLARVLGVPSVGGDDNHVVRRTPRPLVVRWGEQAAFDATQMQVPPLVIDTDATMSAARAGDEEQWLVDAATRAEAFLALGFGLAPSLEQQQHAARSVVDPSPDA